MEQITLQDENQPIIEYGEKEMRYLAACDKAMDIAVNTHGFIRRARMPDLFEALVYSIIGQQISTAAHMTIWKRMRETFGAIVPARLDNATAEEIQRMGMTMRKANYIKRAAFQVVSGQLDIGMLAEKNDADVIAALVVLDGVGVWTAEMLMLFSMGRMDVLSYGDLAIRRGLMKMHGLSALTRETFELFRARYSPYGSIAALYIWAQHAVLQ